MYCPIFRAISKPKWWWWITAPPTERSSWPGRWGARIVHEHRRGYGWACLAGIAALHKPDIVVFLDGDYSDYPDENDGLLVKLPSSEGRADLVMRLAHTRATGRQAHCFPQARFGNWLATWLIRRLFDACFTDLGPFRAIAYPALVALDMQDRTFGWTWKCR